MKDLVQMRLGVLREIKLIKHFFEKMEQGVKSRDPRKIYPAYIFISNLTYHMNEGDLTPLSVELKQELLHSEYVKNNKNLENSLA